MSGGFHFHSEYLEYQDADGKPIGTSAALFLSLLVSIEPDASGWFALSYIEAEKRTGFSHDTQKRLREKLMAAGYLRYRFKGQGGQIHYIVCTQNADKQPVQTDVCTQDAYKGGANEAVCTQNADKHETSDASRFHKSTDHPPTTPPTGEMVSPPIKKPNAKVFIAPTVETIQAYMVSELGGSMADVEQFFDYWSPRDWRDKNGRRMTDWKAMCRTWIRNDRKWEAERKAQAVPVRGSPPTKTIDRRNMGLEEKRTELRDWFDQEGET